MYQHHDRFGQRIDLPLGKVLCIGQNYQDHIAEMNSKTAPEALFFIKPATALADLAAPLVLPQGQGEVHNETELAVLIGKPLKQASEAEVMQAIWGYGLALDLTLRDVQKRLKELGRPWEIAKGFDAACPVSGFIPAAAITNPQQVSFTLKVNGQLRQQGDTAMMIRSVARTIAEMSAYFTLLPGDIVLTGTPAGVGPLLAGDQLEVELASFFTVQTHVSV